MISSQLTRDTYIHKLGQIIKIFLLVYRDLVSLVYNPVVFHPTLEADTECVVTRKVGRLSHQEEAVTPGLEEFLCSLAGDLAVEPGHRSHLDNIPTSLPLGLAFTLGFIVHLVVQGHQPALALLLDKKEGARLFYSCLAMLLENTEYSSIV